MLCNRALRTRAPSHKHTHPLAPSTSTYCRATVCNHEEEFSNPTPSMNTFSYEKRASGSNNAHYLLCYVIWLGHEGFVASVNSHVRFHRAKAVDHERTTFAKEKRKHERPDFADRSRGPISCFACPCSIRTRAGVNRIDKTSTRYSYRKAKEVGLSLIHI